MEFFTSILFYQLYIGLMVVIFLIGLFKVLLPYLEAKKAAEQVKEYLKKVEGIEDIPERFHQFDKLIRNSSNSYIQKVMRPAWEQYYRTYVSYQQEGIAYTPDIYDFFFEENFVQTYGKRKLAETIAGVFLSLGIIGTFIGIAVGVSGLQVGASTEVMQSGIGGLLQGMKVKFLSSIAGIGLSLIWQLVDKGYFYPMLSKSFGKIRQSVDESFPTQDQSTLLYSIDKRQEEQMRDFQSFLSDVLIPNMINGVAGSIERSMNQQIEQSNQMMQRMVQGHQIQELQDVMVNQALPKLTAAVQDSIEKSTALQIEKSNEAAAQLSAIADLIEKSSAVQMKFGEEMLEKMVQGHQMQELQEFMSNHIVPEMVEGFTVSMQNAIVPQMQQTQDIMAELVEQTALHQSEAMQTMADQFVSQLNELTGDHMKNLGDALHATVEWQAQVQSELEGLVQSLHESANSQIVMVDRTTILADRMNQYSEQMDGYHDRFGESVDKLGAASQAGSDISSSISTLLEKMTEERFIFHEHFDSHMSALKENLSTIVEQTDLQATFQHRFQESLKQIEGITLSQRNLAETLAEQNKWSQKSNQELAVIFEKFTHNNSEFIHIQDDFKVLIRDIQKERTTLDEVSMRVQKIMETQVSELDQRVGKLKAVWESTSESLAKTNKHLETSMNQFTDDMHRGLQNTFTQFDEELTKSVSILASGVDAIQDGLIDLPDAMDALRQTINEINRQSKFLASPVVAE
ncbi:hypothetical protein [Saccharibacillus alkalitolerans]|uniref:MotA/TolQ/ExbB proton channel domain-containing protein n=1 Tax=Saccharibacillus alkalitolerans TaxID=2705290 RepID=A0ABX0EZB0_9BACL|nr:hypothetical protein [Saccharibacillus alkalitolerans]NGZ74078.1 hypothetical protein [Saccharibacillus alkalitolerans]